MKKWLKIWLILMEIWIFSVDIWIFLLEIWLFLLEIWIVLLEVWIFLLAIWIFLLEIWLFLLKIWLFMPEIWLSIYASSTIFSLKFGYLGLHFGYFRLLKNSAKHLFLLSKTSLWRKIHFSGQRFEFDARRIESPVERHRHQGPGEQHWHLQRSFGWQSRLWLQGEQDLLRVNFERK